MQRYIDKMFEVEEVEKHYSYATNPDDGTPLMFRGFRPIGDKEKLRPLVIWGHGGGGSYDLNGASDCKKYAETGYVAVSIQRRVNKDDKGFTKEEQKLAVTDTLAAVRYFKLHAKEYKINPEWIFLSGSSAGSETALQSNMAARSFDLGDKYFDDPKSNRANPGVSSEVLGTATVTGSATSDYQNMMEKTLCAENHFYTGAKDQMFPLNKVQECFDNMVRLGIPSTITIFKDADHTIGHGEEISADILAKFYKLLNIPIDLNELASSIAQEEGMKESMDIGQIKEVLRITLGKLKNVSSKALTDLLKRTK